MTDTVISRWGTPIRLTDERWSHICRAGYSGGIGTSAHTFYFWKLRPCPTPAHPSIIIPAMLVKDLGEFGLIARLNARVTRAGARVKAMAAAVRGC